MTAVAQPVPSPQALFAGAAAANMVGQFNVILTAFLLPFAMQHLAISNLVASRYITAELFTFLVTAFIASSVHTFSPKPVAVVGCMLYAVGSFGAALSSEPYGFMAARLFCGVGGALAMIASNRSIASHHHYAKLLSVSIIAVIAFSVVALVGIPAIFETSGTVATYATLGSLATVAAVASLGLTRGTREAPVGIGLNFGKGAWLLVVAFFLSRLSDATLLPQVESFGVRAGLGPTTVGIVLAAATIPTVVTAVLVSRIVTPRGLLVVILGALAIKSFGPLVMFWLSSPFAFSVSQVATSIGYVVAVQVFLTRFSEIDADGRLPGFANTAGLAADTSGLLLGAQVFAASSFSGVTSLTVTIGMAAILLCSLSFPRSRCATLQDGNTA
jgi:MFS family permease